MEDSAAIIVKALKMADQQRAKRQKGLSRRRGACEVCKQRKVRCTLRRKSENDLYPDIY